MLDSEAFFLISINDFFVKLLFKIKINSIKYKVLSSLPEILFIFFSTYEIIFLNKFIFKFEIVKE